MNIRPDNYITINGWMRTELDLKGNELLLYALIYGYSQDGINDFGGSRSYMADFLGVSLPTVDTTLQNLITKGLITKRQEYTKKGLRNRYKAVVKNLYRGSKETLLPPVKKLYRGSKEILPNNKTYNKNNNKLYNSACARNTKNKNVKNSFHNFEQRDYDFDEIERRLVGGKT